MAFLNTGKPMMEDTTSAMPCILRAAHTAADYSIAPGVTGSRRPGLPLCAIVLGSVISAAGLTLTEYEKH